MSNYIKVAKIAGEIAADVLFPSLGISAAVTNSALKSVEKSSKVIDEGDLSKLEAEARLQEIESRISEFQAKVAQELAIARRIENAAEVEIEEFYDTTGNGGVGLQVNEGTLNLGVNGSGRKITKRVYRFKGLIALEDVNISEEK